MSPEARRVLATMSERSGQRYTAAVLSVIVGFPSVRALDELVALGKVRVTGTLGAGRRVFRIVAKESPPVDKKIN